MKRLILIAAVGALLAACGGSNKFTVVGDVKNLSGEVSLVSMFGDEQVLATAETTDGKFKMTGTLDVPTVAYLYFNGEVNGMVLLEGGKIKITGDADGEKFVVGGSNEVYRQYHIDLEEYYQRYEAAETDEERDAVEAEMDAFNTSYIDANRNLAGLLVLAGNTYGLTGSELIDKLDKLPAKIRKSYIAVKLREAAEAKMATEVGQPYIDAVLNDKDGNEVKLSDVAGEGKYVLVDFWASWCSPCMAELPYLKEAYAKYHDKGFEIFGISLDQSKENWLAAVENNQMIWIQTAKLMSPETTADKDYAVSAIPSNFLIDPSGIIIAKNLRGEEVLNKLGELIK